MSGLEDMKTRLNFNGGNRQVDRMNLDKLKSLKKALLYSYQSATAQLSDGREFRCLINPDKLKTDYDNKIISIPFEDICLNEDKIGKTTEGIQPIGMKPGDVFTWKENNTDWIVYLQRFEETAYFRAEIRRCKYEVDIEGTKYKCYAARTELNNIDWRRQHDIIWTDLDYTLQMYITKDELTEAYFHRYTIVKVNGKPWEVQAVDNMNADGLIILALKEYYQNTIEEKVKEEQQSKPPVESNIVGPIEVYPYDTKTYYISGVEGGSWSVGSSKVKILYQDELSAKIYISTGRSGNFELKYIRENEEDIVLNVTIKSL